MIAKRDVIPVFVPHLGCPNDCVFCNQKRITSVVTEPTAEDVTDIILHGLEKSGNKQDIQLAFYGGSFTAIPTEKQDELLGAVLPFLRDGRIASIRLSTRPDAIDSEILDRLREYGVRTIELGCQSMDDEVLRLSGRGHNAEQCRKAARLIKERGFELILQMMTGLPGDDLNRSIATAEALTALGPDGVRIYPTVIVADTALADMWLRGEYKEHTVAEAADWCAELLPIFKAEGIPVIRLGLNPSEELSGGGALGGAYHPAFGELVLSRLMLKNARRALKGQEGAERAVLGVSPSRVSAMAGQHRENMDALKAEFGLKSIKIRPAPVTGEDVVLL